MATHAKSNCASIFVCVGNFMCAPSETLSPLSSQWALTISELQTPQVNCNLCVCVIVSVCVYFCFIVNTIIYYTQITKKLFSNLAFVLYRIDIPIFVAGIKTHLNIISHRQPQLNSLTQIKKPYNEEKKLCWFFRLSYARVNSLQIRKYKIETKMKKKEKIKKNVWRKHKIFSFANPTGNFLSLPTLHTLFFDDVWMK